MYGLERMNSCQPEDDGISVYHVECCFQLGSTEADKTASRHDLLNLADVS